MGSSVQRLVAVGAGETAGMENKKAPDCSGAAGSTLVLDRYRLVTRVIDAPRRPGSR